MAVDCGELITAAFQLHQAVEHCTTAILLVLTGYFGNVFPLGSAEDRQRTNGAKPASARATRTATGSARTN